MKIWMDQGGTFTDVVRLTDGVLTVEKVLSDQADLLALGADASVRRGTTVATNALLERRGAPTLLLSLQAMAQAFCSFANHDRLPSVRANACRTVLEAVGAAPQLLAGEQRLCTALVRQWPGRAFAKNGHNGCR